MQEEKIVNILKSAILLEKKGETLYRQVAKQATSKEVKDFFNQLADDEVLHGEILKKHFQSYVKNKRFDPSVSDRYTTNSVELILPAKLKEDINSAGFEAAAISAAIQLEKNSTESYGARAKETQDPEEIKLFKWLSTWEAGHLQNLMELDKALQEKIWYDNNFWPM